MTVTHATLPAGGGPFALESVTLGVFLSDQPAHRLATGHDKAVDAPLERHQGWLMPAGSEGLCLFDTSLELMTVSLDTTLLREAGLPDPAAFAASHGAIDPLLLSMALNAPQLGAGGALYRETMERAMAAHLAQLVAPPKPESVAIADARLARVVDYIHDHLGDDLTMTAMADLAAMSGTQFSRAFKAATGTSPLQYVITARLDRASVLLRTTQLTVADIAWRVGYQDLSRFGQHFKRRFGTTPAAARG